MSIAFSTRDFRDAAALFDRRWRRHALALAGVAAALLLLFHRDVADLAGIYWNSATFGHCLLVPLVVAWLVWQRRVELSRVAPVAWWPALLWMAAGAGAWLLGAAAGAGIARHLGLVLMLQGAVVTLLGPRVAWALAFPIAYLLFLVPFGQSLEAPLQTLTARMVMALLHLTGVPAVSDGVLITIPNGYFEVAEECSGARFLIAMVALGTLIAHVCFLSWRRRIAFMALAVTVPVLANGVRAFATIYVAHLTSVEAATGFDHIVYGWFFFAFVIAAVLAIAWRWFDRDADGHWFDPGKLPAMAFGRIDLWTGAGLALAVAAGAAGWGSAMAARADRLPEHIDMPVVPGWERVPLSTRAPWAPRYPGADHFLIGRYTDGSGASVDLAIAVYASQSEGRELVAFGQGAIGEDDDWVWVENRPGLAGGAAIRMRAPGPVERETVTWYRVGDVLTGSATRVKIETVKTKLLGGPQAAVAVLASAEAASGVDTRAALRRFVAALGPVERVADHAAGR